MLLWWRTTTKFTSKLAKDDYRAYVLKNNYFLRKLAKESSKLSPRRDPVGALMRSTSKPRASSGFRLEKVRSSDGGQTFDIVTLSQGLTSFIRSLIPYMFFHHLDERNAMVKFILHFDNLTKWTILVVNMLFPSLLPERLIGSSWTVLMVITWVLVVSVRMLLSRAIP